jgi:alkylation response protein AidB-like acyl-CoA dehydrogenase
LFGHPRSEIQTSEGWRNLSAFGIKHGIVAIPYEAESGHSSRVHQFLKYHIWNGSCAITTCPAAMADGAARLLAAHFDAEGAGSERDRVFREAHRNLTSRDPMRAWTSGQWMTERSGGSDVRGTETVATFIRSSGTRDEAAALTDVDGLPLGPYSISGFKWFSSATDSQMAILLAKTENGISAFYAPMRRAIPPPNSHFAPPAATTSELNGVTIQRLKPKLGTRPVPTAELVLKDVRAWPIGTEGRGTREISTVLNITRIHTALSSLGLWGRGLAISRAFARVRKVAGGKLLTEVPAHVRSLSQNTVNYAAMMHLGFFAVAVMGVVEQPQHFDSLTEDQRGGLQVRNVAEATILSRLSTPVAKAVCSKYAIAGLQECMESLGGVGYLEDDQELNVARLFRDANVMSIWEGTTDVLAADVARVITGRSGSEVRRVFGGWTESRIKGWSEEWAFAEELVRAELGKLEEAFALGSLEELSYKGRDVLDSLGWVISAIMLVEDASRDENTIATEVAKRWVFRRAVGLKDNSMPWKESVEIDKRIALAGDVASQETAKL